MTSPWVDGEIITAAKMYDRVESRLDALDVDSGWINSTTNGEFVTAATGFTFARVAFRRFGTVVAFTYSFTLTTAITVASATGNIADTVCGTLATQYASSSPWVQLLSGNFPLVSGYVTTNQIQIAATAPNATLPVGTSIQLGGTYLL